MSDEQQAETADAADDVEEEVEETEAGIQDGDFVKLDYTVRTKEDETVVDTTKQDVAEEAGIDDDDYEFAPRVIVVGAGHVFQSVDDDLQGKDAGDTGTVDIPADEAFGAFDPDDVKTVAADKIPEDDRYPGAQVQIDGDQGRLETIIGGRARVDFNHPLAGEDLEYDYEIVEIVDDREEQAQGLLGMYLQQSPEVWIETDEVEEETVVEPDEDADEDAEPETTVETVEKETLYIEATPQMTMNQQWMFSKQQIAQDMMQRLGIDRVIVQETIDGSGGMMGGMGGMMGGAGGAGGEADIEDALEDVDVDADEIVDELEASDETEE
ncbi:FKBP-type peptidyl-prolyl cis-trans isomerase SlyD [Halogranum amylolyticum]|uniref:peptidylprolyl isomerase n=1 Tax=Halogranum amylolyticum TaxID=660520 RepID=A0A1H8T7J0_9EURY|nr:peptidylprolyl isomerase [Halogranum amylolyticum]SEO86871.1 FKBP-type peptidyl-prolyl cis-trans isomerase SlyD [Halogranum amylolyticum]